MQVGEGEIKLGCLHCQLSTVIAMEPTYTALLISHITRPACKQHEAGKRHLDAFHQVFVFLTATNNFLL
jgi:hypothetical protein